MMIEESVDITKDDLRLLIEGKLPAADMERLVKIGTKAKDRFRNYIELLQEKTGFHERILLRISDALYIVAKDGGGRVVKCACGQELGDYRINWKLACRVLVRKTRQDFAEVFNLPEELLPIDPNLVEIREYYCPNCLIRHGLERTPPGYPPIFDMLPDLDTFYREWLGEPLPDESADWFRDLTYEQTAQWAKTSEGRETNAAQ